MRYSMELSALAILVRQEKLKTVRLIPAIEMSGCSQINILVSHEMIFELQKHMHGSSGYTNGCRCSVCKESRKMDMRKLRKKWKERP